ncbi:hypothetical protein CYLTODRAFT_435415 [Cylindrobasidium torrendii FP15055 ss-10]|uniref:Uncharacterized protein n=1 Tax=Cylindrobasidium torrendii FP15055 ss-10 TaxID=1314674 RepID=A0A0D7BLE4_9AGAR|nr:hypothetical protein CYLTODRAFT_435415 [Cylindrobasidium torrendii FP15055 ss-10]
MKPTPSPTGPDVDETTIHITSTTDFALLAPRTNELTIGNSENEAVAFCHPGSTGVCTQTFPEGFVTAAAMETADDGSYIQITGCIDNTQWTSNIQPGDEGGQNDVRYPQGAKCEFGGYAASFIQLLEPALGRFCIRCCKTEGDQEHCNSHNDRNGCETAIPGTYSFPENGVDCA